MRGEAQMRKSFRVVLALSICGWFAKAQAAEGTPPAGPPAVAGTASSADATAASGGSAPRAAQAPGALGLPSLVGPIGLYGVSTAEVGPVHQLRVGLHAEYFSASDFLVAGDSQQRLRG